MASKHLKNRNTAPKPDAAKAAPPKHSASDGKPKKAAPKASAKPAHEAPKKASAGESAEKKAPKTDKPADPKKTQAAKTGPMDFRPELTEEEKAARKARRLSKKDTRRLILTLTAALILLAACVVVWFFRDQFSADDRILSASSAAAEQEYIFDIGTGEVFASAGQGLAVATSSGLALLDGNGDAVASRLFQMENPAIASCDSYAVFYDIGGTNIAVADFNGDIHELDVEGDIFSVTVSAGGYMAVSTECTGYRGLVTVYDPSLEPVYQWFSSSAWILSAHISPDNHRMAVLSYTASGSEVRLFSLSSTDQLAAFSVSDTVLLDVHWFGTNRLCAYSSSQVFFFNDDGQWLDTYSFAGQFLAGTAFGGDGFICFALSPYRAGTTATLVSLDSSGKTLGTAAVQSEIVSLTASGTEVLVLCSDGAALFSDTLAEKGRLSGLPGFKYGLLRSRGEALLVASGYAEVYRF